MDSALNGCRYFLVGSGCLLLFPGGLWMVTDISWSALDGSCYFLVGSRWLLLFLGGLWMFPAIAWWALDGCYFLVDGWWMVTVIPVLGWFPSPCLLLHQLLNIALFLSGLQGGGGGATMTIVGGGGRGITRGGGVIDCFCNWHHFQNTLP